MMASGDSMIQNKRVRVHTQKSSRVVSHLTLTPSPYPPNLPVTVASVNYNERLSSSGDVHKWVVFLTNASALSLRFLTGGCPARRTWTRNICNKLLFLVKRSLHVEILKIERWLKSFVRKGGKSIPNCVMRVTAIKKKNANAKNKLEILKCVTTN